MNTRIRVALLCATAIVSSALRADSFDWRNVNGNNYMSRVKDQGQCGSCWAYTAVGTVEAQYNIFWNWPDYDINLPEENLVSLCYWRWNCNGGWHHDALAYIRDSGVTDEACFPYVDSDCRWRWCAINEPCVFACTNADCTGDFRCAEWANRLWDIDARADIAASAETIKNHIHNVGPVAVAMAMVESGGFVGDVWRCDNPERVDHCVILVGFDDALGCWIAKNSWGADWGPDGNGYFKIGYGECFVETMPYGATLSNPGTEVFCVKDGSGTVVASFRDNGDLILKGTLVEDTTPTATGSDEFRFQNSSGTDKAVIRMSDGNMYIAGSLYEEQNSLTPSGGDDFIIKDNNGSVVAYIDESGDLYLKGTVYQHPEPPDDET